MTPEMLLTFIELGVKLVEAGAEELKLMQTKGQISAEQLAQIKSNLAASNARVDKIAKELEIGPSSSKGTESQH